MARHRERDIFARKLNQNVGDTFCDLAVEFVDEETLEHILAVGGRWDRVHKCWSNTPAKKALQVKLHKGQLEAARWLARWTEQKITGEVNAETFEKYTCLLLGGARAGKTNLALNFVVAYAACTPKARIWLVQNVGTSLSDELEIEIQKILPSSWYKRRGTKFNLHNGAHIDIRSASKPASLKQGAFDLVMINEGQNIPQMAYALLAMRCADRGGLVVIAANPPNDNPRGEWVNDLRTNIKTGRVKDSVVFEFDPRDNPHVNIDQLMSVATGMSERDFQIEVLGMSLPPSNAVMHAFDPISNVGEPIGLEDITENWCRKRSLGSGVKQVVGMDFQRTPHMAAVVGKIYKNPLNDERILIHYRAEILVDLGDEYDLSKALYDFELVPRETAIICDASGFWQDADRNKGGSSSAILKECGWTRIFRPQRDVKVNPSNAERMKNDNRLFCNAEGEKEILISLNCPRLIQACKSWRTIQHKPDRSSEHSHIADAMSYLNWAMFPRVLHKTKIGYRRIEGRERISQMSGF